MGAGEGFANRTTIPGPNVEDGVQKVPTEE